MLSLLINKQANIKIVRDSDNSHPVLRVTRAFSLKLFCIDEQFTGTVSICCLLSVKCEVPANEYNKVGAISRETRTPNTKHEQKSIDKCIGRHFCSFCISTFKIKSLFFPLNLLFDLFFMNFFFSGTLN